MTIKEKFIDKISAKEETTHSHACSTIPPKNLPCQVVFKIKLVIKIMTFLLLNRTQDFLVILPSPLFTVEETKHWGSQVHLDLWNSAV